MHAARAAIWEAGARGDEQELARREQEAHDRELLALAAEQRVDAAEHRAKAEALHVADAVVSQTERQERIRQRTAQSLELDKAGLRRFRPGPSGNSFPSPGMMGTSGASSRLLAKAREDLDHEIDVIARALEEHGPLERDELKRLVGGRYWGPGRFRAALRAAVEDGRVTRQSSTISGPPDAQPHDEASPAEAGRRGE